MLQTTGEYTWFVEVICKDAIDSPVQSRLLLAGQVHALLQTCHKLRCSSVKDCHASSKSETCTCWNRPERTRLPWQGWGMWEEGQIKPREGQEWQPWLLPYHLPLPRLGWVQHVVASICARDITGIHPSSPIVTTVPLSPSSSKSCTGCGRGCSSAVVPQNQMFVRILQWAL